MSLEEKRNECPTFTFFLSLVHELCDQAVKLIMNSEIKWEDLSDSIIESANSALENQSDNKDDTDKSELDDIFSKVVNRINGDFSYEQPSSLEIKMFQCNNCYMSSLSADKIFCSVKHPCIDNFKLKCEGCKKFINTAEHLKDHMMKEHHHEAILFLICDNPKLMKDQPSNIKNKENNPVLTVGYINMINQGKAEKMEEDSGDKIVKTEVTVPKANSNHSKRTVKPHTIGFKV